MAEDTKTQAKADDKSKDTSKSEAVESSDAQKYDDTPNRSTDGVLNDKDQVSGQNHAAVVYADERDFGEQAAAIAREDQVDIYNGDGAGDEYLYPDLPVSAQNPPKNVVIAYKSDPTGEAANS